MGVDRRDMRGRLDYSMRMSNSISLACSSWIQSKGALALRPHYELGWYCTYVVILVLRSLERENKHYETLHQVVGFVWNYSEEEYLTAQVTAETRRDFRVCVFFASPVCVRSSLTVTVDTRPPKA